jgi:hypothetical protein
VRVGGAQEIFKQYDETVETLQSELILVKAEIEESHKMNLRLGLFEKNDPWTGLRLLDT